MLPLWRVSGETVTDFILLIYKWESPVKEGSVEVQRVAKVVDTDDRASP